MGHCEPLPNGIFECDMMEYEIVFFIIWFTQLFKFSCVSMDTRFINLIINKIAKNVVMNDKCA